MGLPFRRSIEDWHVDAETEGSEEHECEGVSIGSVFRKIVQQQVLKRK